MIFLFFLFLCPELIEDLARATDLKIFHACGTCCF